MKLVYTYKPCYNIGNSRLETIDTDKDYTDRGV